MAVWFGEKGCYWWHFWEETVLLVDLNLDTIVRGSLLLPGYIYYSSYALNLAG